MRVYTLMENQPAGPGYAAEHGLSLYVQAGGRALLVDMGQGDGFLRNAAALGVDISQVEAAILTHGHYDHGGGLGAFYGANQRAKAYIRREAFAPHYRADGGYIGLDPAYIWPSRICWTEDVTNLWPGAYLCTCNGRPMAYGGATEGMYTQMGRERQPDDFPTSNTWCWRKGAAGWYSAAVPTRGYATLPPGCGRMCSSAGFTCGKTPTPPWWSRWGGGCWRWGAYTIPATAPARGPMPG